MVVSSLLFLEKYFIEVKFFGLALSKLLSTPLRERILIQLFEKLLFLYIYMYVEGILMQI